MFDREAICDLDFGFISLKYHWTLFRRVVDDITLTFFKDQTIHYHLPRELVDEVLDTKNELSVRAILSMEGLLACEASHN